MAMADTRRSIATSTKDRGEAACDGRPAGACMAAVNAAAIFIRPPGEDVTLHAINYREAIVCAARWAGVNTRTGIIFSG